MGTGEIYLDFAAIMFTVFCGAFVYLVLYLHKEGKREGFPLRHDGPVDTYSTGVGGVVAVGEIGLDYYYEHSDPKTQLAAFEGQLDVAIETRKPVVIHTREAEHDTKVVLGNAAKNLNTKGVIHSFTSSADLAEFCLAQGFYLGFNGIATFKNADNVREVIRNTPMDRILLETDAPYLTPVPFFSFSLFS